MGLVMREMETVPMQSARIGPGHYEVLGTSRACEVLKVTDPDGAGYGNHGWHLIVDGEWWQTFTTKREALQACQRSTEL